MTVTIGMPYYGCPNEVRRAVRSVLDQTHRDLVLVVIGDGEEPPLGTIRDSRLVLYRLPANRGAYFAQELVIEATPHPWYGVVAADDWVEPDHLDSLLALGSTANVPASVCIHLLDGSTLVQKGLWEVGVFSVDRLRAVGGHNPSERVDQDMLLMKLLRRTGSVAESPRVTYHQVKRRGSLTMDPQTGLTSRYRGRARNRARGVLHTAQRLRFDPERVRDYRTSLVPAAIRQELDEHTERLRALL